MAVAFLLQHMESMSDINTKVSVVQVVNYIIENQSKKAIMTVRALEVLSSILKLLLASAEYDVSLFFTIETIFFLLTALVNRKHQMQ